MPKAKYADLSQSDAEIAAYCHAWVRWCRTRKFYVKPQVVNVLARFMPSRAREAPDARNYPDMPYLNLAIETLAEMPEYHRRFQSFAAFYWVGANAKATAYELHIGRQTYYDHVKQFGRSAYAMSLAIKKAQEGMSLLAGEPQERPARQWAEVD